MTPAKSPKKTAHPKVEFKLRALTPGQESLLESIDENTIVLVNGAAGSGKTAVSVGSAVKALITGEVERIIITRPAVDAGEMLGFLPGGAEEKLYPYLIPIHDELLKFISFAQLGLWKNERKIEIAPLAYMRGRNLHNSYIVADEMQNASMEQLKMLLTRIGNNSKMIINGDVNQSDLPPHKRGGFEHCLKHLNGIDGIGIVHLSSADIVRNPLIAKILERLA